jgi:hypothetical protein
MYKTVELTGAKEARGSLAIVDDNASIEGVEVSVDGHGLVIAAGDTLVVIEGSLYELSRLGSANQAAVARERRAQEAQTDRALALAAGAPRG